MKRFLTFVLALILFTQNVYAETEIDPTDISFESNRKFISSLANVLEQDYDAADVKKGLKPFNDRSVGYRADSFDALIEKLPLASNDLIQSAKQLEILTDPKLLVKLQEEIYFAAVGTISPEAAQSARTSYRTSGLAALALLGGAAGGGGGGGGGGSGPANPQVSISVASASFSENGGSTDVTLTLDRAIEVDLEVTLNFTSDATDGTDYTTDATATISAGNTTTSFTVTAVDDSVYEGNETGIITIASVDQAGVDISSTNSVTITILEDETVPTVSLAASAASVSEESGSGITFTASIDQVAAVDLTVTLSVTVNSRSRSYTPNVPSSIDITLPAGSLTGSAVYTPTDNNSYDGTSNVSFAVSSVVGGGAVANTVNISTTNATETVAITETESAPTVELTALTRTIAEGDDDLTLTATLTGSTYEDVTIVLARAGTATSGTDYSLANITIPAGTTTATAAFSPTADSLYEGANELATITIGSVSGGGVTLGSANTASITITDGDSAPTVTLASSASSVAEGSSVTLTATLSVATTAAVTVPLDTSGATEGTDYGALSDITIAAVSTTGTVTLTATDDSVYEGTETATVSIGTVSGASASAASSGTSVVVTITDAQSAPTVVLSASAESVVEDGSAITLTATLSGVADEDVTVPIDTSGTATEGTDYAAISDITISAGSTTGTATITPTDDSVSEGAETLIVSLGTLSGADATAGSTSSLTLSFVDDDVPNITLTASTTSIAENSGSSITLTVTTSMIATEDIVVSLAAAGTATSGTDYTALPSSLTIAAGDTTKTTSFTPTDDSLYDATSDETVIISISSVSGGNALGSGDQSVTLTITDNESAPTVTLASNVASVDEDGGSATITATLSVATYEDVTIALTGAGTATPDTDYTYTSSITISAGSTTGTASGASIADAIYEGDEVAEVSITSVSGGSATESGTQLVSITITDAESAPTVTLASSASSVAEGSSVTLTATLSVATTAAVTVPLDTSGATEGTDYGALSDITIAAGSTTGTVTLTTTDDSVYEGTETATVSIGTVSGGSASAANSGTSVVVTITDAQSAPVLTLQGSSSSTAERNGTAITITVSSSVAADVDMIVTLSASGTGITSYDYTMTTATISALSQSGTATFTALDDQVYEGGSETAAISVGSVAGISGVSGSGAISINITENALDSGTTATYSASSAATELGTSEFNFMNYVGNSENPLEVINAHKVHGYGLTGLGQVVAVMDSGFYTGHDDLSNTTFTQTGVILEATGDSAGDDHGAIVTGIIAGNNDGSGIVGVAPSAALHLSDFNYWAPVFWAEQMDGATAAGAVAQNNSWGFDQQYGAAGADVFVNYMNTNGISGSETLVAFQSIDTNGDGYYDVGVDTTPEDWSVSDWDTYISSLNNFQSNVGVVVFALSNDNSKTDADISAALPELFESLNEAWLAVANVDLPTGASDHVLYSAPCGSTAEYCLAADGQDIIGLAYDSNGSDYYWPAGGSSFAAPQVSGAVAILAEAFPNHSAEQITDRLLASANNDIGFDFAGSVTFGNGVIHEFSNEAGHGMLDIYAALQPITSSSYITRILSFDRSGEPVKYNFPETSLLASRSFGDALISAFTGEETYLYDAMDGGFAFDSAHLVKPSLSVSQPSMSLGREINRTTTIDIMKKSFLRSTSPIDEHRGYFEASVQQSNKALQNYVAEGQWNGFNDVQYMFPFLSSIQSGDGLSFGNDIGNDYISFSWNKQHAEFADADVKEALTVSYSTTLGTATDLQFIGGFADENEYFLGTKGSGAFDFTGADNITSFFGLKSTTPIGDDLIFSAGTALSYTDVNKPASGIITEISGVTASTFEIGVTAFNVIGKDALSLSIGQPHRVESGSAHLKIAGLENQDGTVPFVEKTASLAPSGRQIDLAMAYNFDLEHTSAIRFKMMQTFEKGHVKDADPEASLYLGYATEDVFGEDSLAFGAAFIDDRDPSLELKYSIRW